MKLFHVMQTTDVQGQVLIRNRIINRVLLSYGYHQNVKQCLSMMQWYWDQGVDDLFLDCGAFSAATKGEAISMLHYMRFIDAVRNVYPGDPVYAQLDVLGDHKRTRRNLETMKKAGFNPIPIYTRGAPLEELRRLIEEEGHDYIALGNLNDFGRIKSINGLKGHLNDVFSISRDRCKLHMFGVARLKLLLEYPFFSCDTSEALKATGYGVIRSLRENGEGVASVMVHRNKKELMKYPHLADFIIDGAKPKSGNRPVRLTHNAINLMKMERHITKTWALRGINWDEPVGKDDARWAKVSTAMAASQNKKKRRTNTGQLVRRTSTGVTSRGKAGEMRNKKGFQQ